MWGYWDFSATNERKIIEPMAWMAKVFGFSATENRPVPSFGPLWLQFLTSWTTAVGWRGRQLCEDSMKLYFFKHVFSWLAPEGSMCCISPLSHQNLPAKDRIKPRCVTLVEKLRGFRFCDALLPGCYQFNCLCPHRSAAVNYAGVCFKTLYLES